MKKLKYYISIIIVAVAFSACDNFLELEPQDTIPTTGYWQTRGDAQAWMAGIYNQFQRTLQTNYFQWGESRSDNVNSSGTGAIQFKMTTNTLSANDQDLRNIVSWADLYRTISLCNYGIKNFPEMIEENRDGGAPVYTDYLGQCYAIRALMYFYGLRVWGGMPLILQPIDNLGDQKEFPRATVLETEKQILSDLHIATPIISGDNSRKYYINRAAVYAMKTDVYMWMQDYTNAIAASDTFLTTTTATWISTSSAWKTIFLDTPNSTETVFSLYWDFMEFIKDNGDTDGFGAGTLFAKSTMTPNYKFTPELFMEMFNRIDSVTVPGRKTKLDARFWMSWDTCSYKTRQEYVDGYNALTGTNTNVYFGKFNLWDPSIVNKPGRGNGGFVYVPSGECNIRMPIYRYADVMTLRAEALALGKYDFTEALKILNKVRSRVGYNPTITMDSTGYIAYYNNRFGGDNAAIAKAMQRVILKERQYEFVGEGKRWFDLQRVGNMYDLTDAGYEYLREVMNPIMEDRNPDAKYDGANIGRVLFPIAANAFNNNPALIGDQNPPYDE